MSAVSDWSERRIANSIKCQKMLHKSQLQRDSRNILKFYSNPTALIAENTNSAWIGLGWPYFGCSKGNK